jgi:hypothetical protein
MEIKSIKYSEGEGLHTAERFVSIGQLIYEYKVEIGRNLAGMVISHAKLFPFKVRKVVPKLGITNFYYLLF